MKENVLFAEKFISIWLQYQKNVYIDKSNEMVNEYNNTYRTMKVTPVDIKDNTYIDSVKEVNDKIPNLTSVT